MLRIILDCNSMKFNEKFTNDEEIRDCLGGKYTASGLKQAQNETLSYLREKALSGYGYLLGDFGCMMTRDLSFCTNEALEIFGDIVLVKYLTNEYVSVRNLINNGVIDSADMVKNLLQTIDFEIYTVNDPRQQYIGQSGVSDGEHITIVGFEYYKNENLVFKYNDKWTDYLGYPILSHDVYIDPQFRESINQFMVISVKDFLKGKLNFKRPNYIQKPSDMIDLIK